ncbi:hypothetical protein EOA13_11115 [Mesorhizobium sp. M7A.F.Ca.US.011.01.1.1]|uniref:hypothetical protein n=1 Tax=Mesorhizobium sp. M7A.F.Ca.US.011.01.1.1 TaxID=2496741 RepID=UPI000FCCDC59|nr:hypothetical protein [Mesorhizobium sp. M7A.F.Ca.US.011.01.1.1]RUX29930.1 hypothetical protein EOA13_11115 [Mesorhizobium sp. M7A.F.Ca.US.011.01.1.1]
MIFLRQLADYQREAADLHVTIANTSEASPQASPEYFRMIGWAEQRLAQMAAQNQLDILTSNLR